MDWAAISALVSFIALIVAGVALTIQLIRSFSSSTVTPANSGMWNIIRNFKDAQIQPASNDHYIISAITTNTLNIVPPKTGDLQVGSVFMVTNGSTSTINVTVSSNVTVNGPSVASSAISLAANRTALFTWELLVGSDPTLRQIGFL